MTAFCHPAGTLPVVMAGPAPAPPPRVHYFVLTGEAGQRMYGTCLTVWEGHAVSVEERRRIGGITTTARGVVVHLPKCLVFLSLHPYLVAFREFLVQLHRMSRAAPPPPPPPPRG